MNGTKNRFARLKRGNEFLRSNNSIPQKRLGLESPTGKWSPPIVLVLGTWRRKRVPDAEFKFILINMSPYLRSKVGVGTLREKEEGE